MKKKNLLIVLLTAFMCACSSNSQSSSNSTSSSEETTASTSEDTTSAESTTSEESTEPEVPTTPITEEEALDLTNSACASVINNIQSNNMTYKITAFSTQVTDASIDMNGDGVIDMIDKGNYSSTQVSIINKSFVYNYSKTNQNGYRKITDGETVIFDAEYSSETIEEQMFKATNEKLYCLSEFSSVDGENSESFGMYCTHELNGITELKNHVQGVIFTLYGGYLGLSEDIQQIYINEDKAEVSYGIKGDTYLQNVSSTSLIVDEVKNQIFTITANKDNFADNFESRCDVTYTIDDEPIGTDSNVVTIEIASEEDIAKANEALNKISETNDYPDDYISYEISNYLEVRNGL